MVMEGVFQGDVGWAVDEIRQDFPGEGVLSILLPEDIESLFNADYRALSEQIGDLVSRSRIAGQSDQEGQVVELFIGYKSAKGWACPGHIHRSRNVAILDHLKHTTTILEQGKSTLCRHTLPLSSFLAACQAAFPCQRRLHFWAPVSWVGEANVAGFRF